MWPLSRGGRCGEVAVSGGSTVYTLFRAERPKTIPYPAARTRIAHIGEFPSSGAEIKLT